MHLTFALLVLGACGFAEKTVVEEPSIAAVVFNVAIGGVRDVGLSGRFRATGMVGDSQCEIRLAIDGELQIGWPAYAIAAVKIAGFVTDTWTAGAVEWDYHVAVGGLRVWRHTEIRDGYVRLTTDIRGPMGPRGELHRVLFTITASEGSGGTTITATAKGWTNIGRRCRLVARIAEREISKGLQRDLLGAVESGGRRLYASGDVWKVVDVFVARMR
jgi:hypothetical protein